MEQINDCSMENAKQHRKLDQGTVYFSPSCNPRICSMHARGTVLLALLHAHTTRLMELKLSLLFWSSLWGLKELICFCRWRSCCTLWFWGEKRRPTWPTARLVRWCAIWRGFGYLTCLLREKKTHANFECFLSPTQMWLPL